MGDQRTHPFLAKQFHQPFGNEPRSPTKKQISQTTRILFHASESFHEPFHKQYPFPIPPRFPAVTTVPGPPGFGQRVPPLPDSSKIPIAAKDPFSRFLPGSVFSTVPFLPFSPRNPHFPHFSTNPPHLFHRSTCPVSLQLVSNSEFPHVEIPSHAVPPLWFQHDHHPPISAIPTMSAISPFPISKKIRSLEFQSPASLLVSAHLDPPKS